MRTLSLVSGVGVTLVIAACAPSVRVYGTGGGGGEGTSSTSTTTSTSATTSTTSTTGTSTTSTSSTSDASSSSSGGAPKTATFPVAPQPGLFMWQGVQDQFLDQDMQPCNARIAIAASDQAVCFVAASGNLNCAGQIYANDYGPTFTDTGVAGVEQILMSSTFNAANHDSICVVVTGAGGSCWGGANDQGQFGDGDKMGSAGPVPWGAIPDLHRIATGTWDQICGMTTAGDAYCAGYGFDVLPMPEGGGHTSLFVDTFGMLNLDSPSVVRVPNSRVECKITVDGYDCGGPPFLGVPGNVVDGTVSDGRACWLDGQGHVSCSPPMGPPIVGTMFTALPVLALAGNYYTDDLCAVYNDGSISCVGPNDHGQLGTGDTMYLSAETIVAPPGTIDVTCK